MNNEEKNPDLIEDQVDENNDLELDESESPKKPSSGLITLIITLAACVLVAVILIVALLPKNNGGDNNQNNNENSGENGGNEGGNEGGTEGGNEGGNGEADSKVRYTVTVVDEDGNAVSGVEIYFYPEGGVDFPKTTEEDGLAIYTTDKNLTVAVTKIPEGYKPYEKLTLKQNFDASGNLLITLTKEEVRYYDVYVVDEEGNYIAGVLVQICGDKTGCKMPQSTDENGKASFTYNDDEVYHAQLTELPAGYTVDDVSAYYDIVNGVATITLTKVSN